MLNSLENRKLSLPVSIKIHDCNGNGCHDFNGNNRYDTNGNNTYDANGNGKI